MSNQTIFSMGDFVWWIGEIIDIYDEDKLGRYKVRIKGFHSDDLSDDDLGWYFTESDITSAGKKGVGRSPTGLLKGSFVRGYFLDGIDAQIPVIVGVFATKTDGEKDINKLATGERRETSVQFSSSSAGKGWSVPNDRRFKTKYPHNHVKQSEHGIVEQWNDTEDDVRYQFEMPSGHVQKIHPDGTHVTKIVKSRYTLIAEDDHLLVSGDVKITVVGDAYIEVGGDCKSVVGGNHIETIGGNLVQNVGGNYVRMVGGSTATTSAGQDVKRASNIHLN